MLAIHEFWTLLMSLQVELKRRARRLTQNPSDASDLVQATNLRALEKRALFVSGSAHGFMNWLFRVMVNLHRDGLRAGTHEMVVDWLDDVPGNPETSPPLWTMLDDGQVVAAVERLPPKLRVVY